MADQLCIFSVGNGDTIFLNALNKTILTDLNYREGSEDDDEKDMLEIASHIRGECFAQKLDVFVCTHPDADHVRRFDELFHLGEPDAFNVDSKKILAKEIWCSSYAVDAAYDTDESKLILKEIRRRNKLSGPEKTKDGNRLKIVDADSPPVSIDNSDITATPLAPTKAECDIGKGDGDDKPSANPTSLVIQWTVSIGNYDNQILLGGDAPAEIWERLDNDADDADLRYDILVAPHHCSRHSLGSEKDDGEFEYSDKAISALGHIKEGGLIVSSSKELKNNTDNPPSYEAKKKYVAKMLGSDGGRFFCTGGIDENDPRHLCFNLTGKGPVFARQNPTNLSTKAATTSVGGGGSYGWENG